MSDDERTMDPEDVESVGDSLSEASEFDVLPLWLQTTLTSNVSVDDADESSRLHRWLPVFGAAWSAGRSGVALATALQAQLDTDEPLQWPEQLSAELVDALGELGEAIPPFEEAVPALTRVVDAGEEYIDPDVAQQLVVDTLSQLEGLGQRAVEILLDTAFFTPEPENVAERTQHLHQLFLRLEALFDRALQAWLAQQS